MLGYLPYVGNLYMAAYLNCLIKVIQRFSLGIPGLGQENKLFLIDIFSIYFFQREWKEVG